MDQFEENLGILTIEELESIKYSNVLLIGLGGLGGYIANSLARLGVTSMTLVDFDIFQLTNLNRQLFSMHSNLGMNKTEVIQIAIKKINPKCQISIFNQKIEAIDLDHLGGFDLIIDAVDNIETKCYLENLGERLNIPLIHGAVGGWYGQVGIILPGSKLLNKLYEDNQQGIEKIQKSPTFTPAIVANIMIAEMVKLITKKPSALINKIMLIDLLNHQYKILFK